ncbi:HEPN domain-containing protein [Pseudomonas putida]|uniref:ApeA N-terminal domain 1-containing protein n=1 Tax=Pseudomonas putida TaxID=303 RepID=UPI0011DF21E3|nr:HEPN domain-containing protein [Pseudomonas putida]
MRLSEKYERAGVFWLPAKPERKVPGTLTIANGGVVELSLHGSLDGGGLIDSLKSPGSNYIGRIVGEVVKDGYVTIEKCQYANRSFSLGKGLSQNRIRATQVFVGFGSNDDSPIEMTHFSFRVDGADAWFAKTGLEIDFGEDNEFHATYTPLKSIVTQVEDFKLVISFGHSITPSQFSLSLNQKVKFELSSDRERPVSDFMSAAFKITNFISFGLDITVGLHDVKVGSRSLTEEVLGVKRLLEFQLYYSSLPEVLEEPEVGKSIFLFLYPDVQDKFDKVLGDWFAAYENIKSALDLYFSVATGAHRYTDGRFLALIQGLETFHRTISDETLKDEAVFRRDLARVLWSAPKDLRRWVHGRTRYGNELTLGTRLSRIMKPFASSLGNAKARSKFVSGVTDTRNYFTHYNPTLKSRALDGAELLRASYKLEALFQLCLLQTIGFTEEEISKLMKRSPKINRKMSM